MTINPNNSPPPSSPGWMLRIKSKSEFLKVRHLIRFSRKTSEKEFLELVFTAKKGAQLLPYVSFWLNRVEALFFPSRESSGKKSQVFVGPHPLFGIYKPASGMTSIPKSIWSAWITCGTKVYKIAINSWRVCQKEKRRKYIGKWYFRAKRGILDYLEKNVYE